jgi:hypothetical protein
MVCLDKSNNTEPLVRLYLGKLQDKMAVKQCDAPLQWKHWIWGGC